MKAFWSWIVAGVVALSLITGVNYCRGNQLERHGVARQAVTDQKAVVAKQDSIVIRDTLRLAGKDRVVTRTVTDYRTLRDTIIVHDSVLIAAADTAIRACEDYRNTCRQTTADFLQLRLDHVELERRFQKLVDSPRPRRRWGLGCSSGGGFVVAGGQVYAGPGASCGLAISF